MLPPSISYARRRPFEVAPAHSDPAHEGSAAPNAERSFLRRAAGWFEDVGLLLLVVSLFVLAILVAAMPIALVVRLVLEVASRW